MSLRATVLSLTAGIALLVGVALGLVAFRGDGPEVLRGIAIGAGLGVAGSILETILVYRALRHPKGKALNIVLGGFGLRLVLMVGLALLFARVGYADPQSFALAYLGGFLAALPLLGVASFRLPGTAPVAEGRP